MTVTISWNDDKTARFSCERKEFRSQFGVRYIVVWQNVFKTMEEITAYMNNRHGEECLFEVE